MVKQHKKKWYVGKCKHCLEDLFNDDSFVSFADKTSSHYSCMEKEDLIQQNNKVTKNA